MVSFRRCPQRTPPKQELGHLTLCSSKMRTQDETGVETAAE